jgi:hypothetical protein
LSADPANYRERPLELHRDRDEPAFQKYHFHMEDECMNECIVNFDGEDDVLNYEVADEAVEAAAGILEGQAKSMTAAFCSGLDTRPS